MFCIIFTVVSSFADGVPSVNKHTDERSRCSRFGATESRTFIRADCTVRVCTTNGQSRSTVSSSQWTGRRDTSPVTCSAVQSRSSSTPGFRRTTRRRRPHVDHIGQVQTVLDAGNPTVHAPATVRERLTQDATALGHRVRENVTTAGLTGDAADAEVESAVESLERNRRLLPPETVDEWLTPGAVSFGSISATAVHTPGHQADHLAYLLDCDGDTVLLSGDTAMEPFRAVVLHDGMDDGHAEAFEASFTALDRLEQYDPDRVFAGHGEPHSQFHEILARDRRRLDRRLDAIEELVTDGFSTVPEVATELARGRDPRYMYAETMSGLAHLDGTDRIESELVDGVRRYE
ncbi:hydroxyacylglutathione hydrolase [Halobacteriales archaeon QH_7_65_31]|nr:MAG: hydroxyacylglutathione hydrolase [Halobacteriales archaeon QH_7_65_31]